LGHARQGGRLCVAAAAGEGAPRGILLGASGAGGMQFVEPPAAVPLNNELAAARAEALAADEAVLWRLTGRVADAEADLTRALDVVRPQAPALFCSLAFGLRAAAPLPCQCLHGLSGEAHRRERANRHLAAHIAGIMVCCAWAVIRMWGR